MTDRSTGADLLRDQQRAIHAYQSVAEVPKAEFEDYRIAVNSLGINILSSGLSAAFGVQERLRERPAVGRLTGHLAGLRVPGLGDATGADLAARIRALDADAYMLATREFLKGVVWFKRAVQAASVKE